MDAAHFTVLPRNILGDDCIRELRRWGVDTSRIIRGEGRMGLYFMDAGANQLSGKVLYDREYSSMALADPKAVDWDQVLGGMGWLHITGITPAISLSAAELSLAAVREAKSRGLTVSCDLNYRNNLWKYGVSAPEIMCPLCEHVDILIANEDSCLKALNIAVDADGSEQQRFRTLSDAVLKAYPGLKLLAVTLRSGSSADSNTWAACMSDRENFYSSRSYDIRDIVDRVGGGDAFAAGLIYGLSKYDDLKKTLEFATAASCLKHSIIGDFNRVSAADVEALMYGPGDGRVQR